MNFFLIIIFILKLLRREAKSIMIHTVHVEVSAVKYSFQYKQNEEELL